MTGRDLIIYILANGLEDEPVFKDGKFLGLITETEAAVKLGMGVGTIRAWITLGRIKSVRINDIYYVPADVSLDDQQMY
jgi:hypothetical protein